MSLDSLEFRDRRIVVTGGTQGTGRAVIQRFANAGAVVVTAARSSRPAGTDFNVSSTFVLRSVDRAAADVAVLLTW